MKECVVARPRERIVGTARSLFHKLGFRGVGVDTIAEEAGTNKMTLYRHFDSKDDLIVECLRSAAMEARKFWLEIESQHPDNRRAQLEQWIDLAAHALATDFRGCDLTNAAIELADAGHPAHRVIEEFKAEHRDWLAKVCAGAGVNRAELLADTLTTLLEGARVGRQSASRDSQRVDFAAMARTIVESFKRKGAR